MKRNLILTIGLLMLAPAASAALSVNYQFNGQGNWSLDGCGSSSNVCDISAEVPVGSTIETAFLYSSKTPGAVATPTVDFDGSTYSGVDWTHLGANAVSLSAYRADVTAQVVSKIGGGNASPFTFSVLSESSSVDGEVLAIIYSNPAESTRTIAFLDGFSDSSGDTAALNLAHALTAAEKASLEATMSLGIGFSYQTPSNQTSVVDVNGINLTNCAGGQDDGDSGGSGLITVGGLGDDAGNGDINCGLGNARRDDELYDLGSFMSTGDTQIVIDTLNPSNDDNIFFAGFNINVDANIVNCEDTNSCPNSNSAPVPEPGTILLISIGILGMAGRYKKISSS